MVKGILEGCILKIIQKGETYGYKTVSMLNDMGFGVNEATVYPILARLQDKGMLSISKRPSPFGPVRKYYTLTEDGEKYLEDFLMTWKRISDAVNKIMEGEVI
jgi:PadR family transcriptional regulator PadR